MWESGWGWAQASPAGPMENSYSQVKMAEYGMLLLLGAEPAPLPGTRAMKQSGIVT